MASSPAVKLELGASVTFTVGIAFKSVEDRIKKNTKVLESIFAEVLRLRSVPAAVPSPVAPVGELRPYMAAMLGLLEQQIVALGLLRQQPQAPASTDSSRPSTKQASIERDNLKVFEDLPVIGQAVKVGRALILPPQISAQYQKITRDIAISAGGATGVAPSVQEQKVIGTVSAINEATGMERNQAAMLVKQLYDSGMGLDKALAYAPVAAKFSVGQDVQTEDTVRLIGELQRNSNVTGPAELEGALEHIVLQRKGTGEGAADSLSAAQNLALGKALGSEPAPDTRGVLDRDLTARRGTSDQLMSEASNAADDALRSLGDAIRPLSDGLAQDFTATAKAFTGAPDSVKVLLAGAAVLGTTFLALKGGSVFKGLLEAGRDWIKGSPEPTKTSSRPRPVPSLSKVLVLNNPLRVFVVNAREFGCRVGRCGRQPMRKRAPSPRRKSPQRGALQRIPPPRRRRGKSRSAPTYSRPVVPIKPLPLLALPAPASNLTAVASPPSRASNIGAGLKGMRGPAVLEAGINAVSTLLTADTPEQKAEGYGAAAGGLVGSVIGGMVGSVVPVIGTSIGAMLGGMAGDAIGGWVGKRMVESSKAPAPAIDMLNGGKPAAPQPGDVVRGLVNAVAAPDTLVAAAKAPSTAIPPAQITQQFTFTPSMPITVQGSVTDPVLLAQNLQAMVRREFEELMRMATSRQLADVPHVYV